MMLSLFGSVLMLVAFQGISPETGVVAGTLRRGDDMKPVSGVRVALVAAPEPDAAADSVRVLVSITQTDSTGAYRLENVPAGRYYIVAGRVGEPTYFPGTLEPGAASPLTVMRGAVENQGMDFVVLTESLQSVADPPSGASLAAQKAKDLSAKAMKQMNELANAPPISFSIALESLTDANREFKYGAGSVLIWRTSRGGGIAGDEHMNSASGMVFQRGEGAQELRFRCRASECRVDDPLPNAATPSRTLKKDETGIISTSAKVIFTVVP